MVNTPHHEKLRLKLKKLKKRRMELYSELKDLNEHGLTNTKLFRSKGLQLQHNEIAIELNQMHGVDVDCIN